MDQGASDNDIIEISTDEEILGKDCNHRIKKPCINCNLKWDWFNTKEFAMVQRRCLEFVRITKFKNNCVYEDGETIESAYEKALSGLDNGVLGMQKLMPEGSDIEKWLDFFFFCYLMYGRCK